MGLGSYQGPYRVFLLLQEAMRRRNDFPASALLTVAGFARLEMMVEIQGVAVVAD